MMPAMRGPERLIAVLLVLAAACGGGGKKATVAGGTTTTPTTVAATTTSVAVTTTGAKATTTTKGAAGTVLTAAGALLEAAPQPTVQSTQGPAADCHTLGDTGFTVEDCGRVDTAGGTRVWLVESKPGSPAKINRVFVMHFSQGKGAWLVDLRFADDKGPTVSGVKVHTGDLTGDGKPEIIVAFHMLGSGSFLNYDLVTDSAGGEPKVAASRQLSHGQASLVPPAINDREAKYPNGEPNCCPAFLQNATVSFSNGSFRVVETTRDNPNTAPPIGPNPL